MALWPPCTSEEQVKWGGVHKAVFLPQFYSSADWHSILCHPSYPHASCLSPGARLGLGKETALGENEPTSFFTS